MRSTRAADDVLTADTRARVASSIRSSGARIGADRVMLIALVIALHADADGRAYPSLTTLESLVGIPARLLKQAVAVLAAAEVIEVIREPGRHNVYRFTYPAGMPADPPSREPSRDADQTQQGTQQGTRQASLPRREGKIEGEGARSPHCTKHPDGTDEPCRGCMVARQSFEAWEAKRQSEREENVRCPHGIPRGDWLDSDGVSTGGCLRCEPESQGPSRSVDVSAVVASLRKVPS